MSQISFISIGGTIASVDTKEGLKPGQKPENLLKQIPELQQITDEIRCRSLLETDSANLQPRHWIQIATAIFEEMKDPDVKGIVVTHGTDTMVYSLAATSFMIQNPRIPIVFTGAQIPLTEVGSDGRKNLLDAFRVASTAKIGEVMLVFDSTIFRGTRCRKMHAYALSAFTSMDQQPFGTITRKVEFHRPPAKPQLDLRDSTLDTRINPDVTLVKLHPGMKPEIFDSLFSCGIKGLVIEAYGDGNLPIEENSLIPILQKLNERKIPVVVTTQCIFGMSEMKYYETGRKAYDIGCIPGFDMISEVAMVKLMIALARVKKFDDIEAFIHKPLIGEIHPL